MWVPIVRRAGKSPPGMPSIARPVRASSGPSSSTDPRSLPTSSLARLRGLDVPAAHADGGRAEAVHFGADFRQQLRHHLDVADARHVREHALFGGQQARRQQRKRGVLVAFDVDLAGDRASSFNQQTRHQKSPR